MINNTSEEVQKDKAHTPFIPVHPQPWATSSFYTCRVSTNRRTNCGILQEPSEAPTTSILQAFKGSPWVFFEYPLEGSP